MEGRFCCIDKSALLVYAFPMDTVSERAIIAKKKFESGYNCAQSVAIAFADILGMDEKTAAKLASPFGGGIGRLRETCGAVTGMLMVLGMCEGYQDNNTGEEKALLYEKVRAAVKKFTDVNHSIKCSELLDGVPVKEGERPEERTARYYAVRPCADIVYSAASIAETFIKKP